MQEVCRYVTYMNPGIHRWSRKYRMRLYEHGNTRESACCKTTPLLGESIITVTPNRKKPTTTDAESSVRVSLHEQKSHFTSHGYPPRRRQQFNVIIILNTTPIHKQVLHDNPASHPKPDIIFHCFLGSRTLRVTRARFLASKKFLLFVVPTRKQRASKKIQIAFKEMTYTR